MIVSHVRNNNDGEKNSLSTTTSYIFQAFSLNGSLYIILNLQVMETITLKEKLSLLVLKFHKNV